MKIVHYPQNNFKINHTSENNFLIYHFFKLYLFNILCYKKTTSINVIHYSQYTKNFNQCRELILCYKKITSINVTHYSQYAKKFNQCRELILKRFGKKGDKITYKNKYNGIYISKSLDEEKCYIRLDFQKDSMRVSKSDVRILKML